MKYLAPLFAFLTLSCTSLVKQESFLYNHDDSIPKIVDITGQHGGTGFFLDYKDKQWIVTNHHVCEGVGHNGKMTLLFRDGSTVEATIVEQHATSDLCLATTERHTNSAFTLAGGYRLYQSVWAFGHPSLYENILSEGRIYDKKAIEIVVSANEECNEHQKKVEGEWFGFTFKLCTQAYMSLHVSAGIYPGNSGSPLLDENGDVLGVIFAGDNLTHYGLAVPLEELRLFLDKYSKE